MKNLTIKQKKFVNEYLKSMNATQSAISAGYSAKSAYSIASENLRKPEIKEVIFSAMKEHQNDCLLSREQRQKFWQSIMLNEELDLKDRIKASELLAKSFGDFDAAVIERERLKNMSLADEIKEMHF